MSVMSFRSLSTFFGGTKNIALAESTMTPRNSITLMGKRLDFCRLTKYSALKRTMDKMNAVRFADLN
jgi:hypothetical protein